ncbi:MAG: DNA mismatch repair protein MutS [Oscillospiraceae bacterium]|nr:DNA mismatch repair protein MutS [Oscillospiraceae bacterium]
MPEPTPMMKQYLSIKDKHPDCILFFRLGDFYEMFHEDARLVSNLLSLTLTSRDRGVPEEERVPMCGVPYHSAEGYIAKLIQKGYRVAICEQTEDPALAKGLVKRDVVRIMSPGALIEPNLLEETRNNYICGVFVSENSAGVCFCDISTGEMAATEFHGEEFIRRVITELGRYAPKEAVLCPEAERHGRLTAFLRDNLFCAAQTRDIFGTDAVSSQWPDGEATGLDERPAAAKAAGGLLVYLRELMCDEVHLTLNVYEHEQFLELDYNAKQTLELTETMRSGEKKGSLLSVMDMTKTAMGGRTLRGWLERPLANPAEINRRLYAVAELTERLIIRGELQGALHGLPDMERILTRILYGTANARDLRALRNALERVPRIKEHMEPLRSPGLRELRAGFNTPDSLFAELDAALIETPPFSIREGGFIKDGYHPEVDRLRSLVSGARDAFMALEAAERARSGIKSLKVGYNKVFGYYIEVSKSYLSQVPEDYTRKQTVANGERYVTQELKTLEAEILSAGDRLAALEGEVFAALRNLCVENADRIQSAARALAGTDALCSFAEIATAYDYCQPVVDYSDACVIRDGRHPVVERMLDHGLFVPNDTELTKQAPTVLVTGPNMAGKSTYMRQTALIVLLAQAGSFVPAKSAHIGVVDRIFTRVGASDDVAGGRSTFMVEMTEVADILRFATKKSLILFDEVGRGTSTFDGMSVAQAVLEYTHKKIGAKTLFATHYHELTALEKTHKGIQNVHVSVKKKGEEIVFLRRVVPGGADDSYGVEVARLAGLPGSVITRARAILNVLESNSTVPRKADTPTPPIPHRAGHQTNPQPTADPDIRSGPCPQVSLEHLAAEAVVETLKSVDINTLTPIEALNLLHTLIKKVK